MAAGGVLASGCRWPGCKAGAVFCTTAAGKAGDGCCIVGAAPIDFAAAWSAFATDICKPVHTGAASETAAGSTVLTGIAAGVAVGTGNADRCMAPLAFGGIGFNACRGGRPDGRRGNLVTLGTAGDAVRATTAGPGCCTEIGQSPLLSALRGLLAGIVD